MINDIVSEKLQVKELKDNEIVIYSLIGAGEPSLFRTDEHNKPVPKMPVKMIAGEEYINDPFDKKQPKKLIQNVVGYTPVKLPDQTIQHVPKVEKIRIDGTITVNSSQPELYQFLERSNKNLSNPFRDKAKKAMFYRVDNKKAVLDETFNNDLIDYAISIVKAAQGDDMKAIYRRLPETFQNMINLDNLEGAKNAMRKIAREHPRLIIEGGNEFKNENATLATMLIELQSAEEWRILVFDEANRRWTLHAEGEKPQKLCAVEPGVSRLNGLLEWFLNPDNENAYSTVVKELSKVRQADYAY